MTTASIYLAKKLKENGYPQESEFYYIKHAHSRWRLAHKVPHSYRLNNLDGSFHCYITYYKKYGFIYSAPMADELLERLPYKIKIKDRKYLLEMGKGETGFYVSYCCIYDEKSTSFCEEQECVGLSCSMNKSANKLPDALSEMWLYLKKEGLL